MTLGMFGATGLKTGKRYPLGVRLKENGLAKESGVPGVISGYGGGTWNVDGSVATLPDGSASTMGWDTPDEIDPLPRPATPSQPTSGPTGLWGNSKAWSATAMGELPERNGRAFDYDAALAKLLPADKKPSTLRQIAGIVGPALMGAVGNQAGANALIANMAQQRAARERQRALAYSQVERWKHDDFARQHGADLRASAPRVIGRSMVQYDPEAGEVNELYDGPEDYEIYPEALGLEPGTPEYFEAVEDYVLKSDGPSAYERDTGLDDHRTGNRIKIEGVRQGHRESLEGTRQRNRLEVRGTPTYRDRNPAPRRSGRPTATGPGGQRVEWNGNAWVPAT